MKSNLINILQELPRTTQNVKRKIYLQTTKLAAANKDRDGRDVAECFPTFCVNIVVEHCWNISDNHIESGTGVTLLHFSTGRENERFYL